MINIKKFENLIMELEDWVETFFHYETTLEDIVDDLKQLLNELKEEK